MRKVRILLEIVKYVEDLPEAQTVAKSAAGVIDTLILTTQGETVTVKEVTDEGEAEEEAETEEG